MPQQRNESLSSGRIPKSESKVVFLSVNVSPAAVVPGGFLRASTLVAALEKHPDRAARLKKARQRVGADFYDEQGSVVARARLKLGWSQKQLAEAIGTSQPHIARIEGGRENLLLTIAVRLADALEQDRAEFVCQLASE